APCPQCGGRGRQGMRACTRCGGTGTVEQREQLTVKIPAGVGDGARVRVKGKGGVGRGGAPAGDLYFIVKVRPHPFLQRDGKDLTIEVPITVGEAIRGATIAVPTPHGTVRLKVPRGIQSGQRPRPLSREEEHELAVRWHEHEDRQAAWRLVTANLRLVVMIAREYQRAFHNLLDLVQEGNVGLLEAVKNFDPYRGIRFPSYAVWWI